MHNYIVEKHFIKRSHPQWQECDTLCFSTKNLYNQALYRSRQSLFQTGKYKNYSTLQKELQDEKIPCYSTMKSKVAQLVLKQVDHDLLGFFRAIKEWEKCPNKFLGKPNLPKYKDKNGRCSVSFNVQSMSKKAFKHGILQLSGLLLKLPLQHTIEDIVKEDGCRLYKTLSIKEATISPCNDGYLVVIKHETPAVNPMEDTGLIAGIDIGVNNLAAVSTNVKSHKSTSNFLLNGRPVKSINHYYNKKLTVLRSKLNICNTRSGKKKIKYKIQKLCRKRGHKINDYLHKSSRIVVNQLASLNVTHLIVGKNDGWKQEANMGKRNNQNFVQFPHAKFIEMLKYKWNNLGGKFTVTEESYSSKCSFLDGEELKHHNKYIGRRVKRGLFKSKEGYLLNADINGSANIVRKVIKNAWAEWTHEDLIGGFVVSPVDLIVSQLFGYEKLQRIV
jgi:putative transposase